MFKEATGMTTTTLPPSAESAAGDIRELLTDATQVYASYVHFYQTGHHLAHEYCNMSDGDQRLSAVLVTTEGRILSGSRPRVYVLKPQELMRIDTSDWARSTGLSEWSGQLLVLVEQITTHGAKHIYPAITAHWISTSHHCEIATAAFGQLNLRKFNGKKSFYMYCSMAAFDARRTTYIVLFNNSSDAGYQDTVSLEAALCGRNGERLAGPPVLIAPFGAAVVDIGEHFGAEGQKFLTDHRGHVGAAMRHLGHTFPAYFFHVDRQSRDILSGQHAQPPMAALTHFNIWWGKLRQFAW
jgi:hypothetical protein